MPTIFAEGRGAIAPSRLSCPEGQRNYFNSAEVAQRYTRVRPRFHEEVAERIRAAAGVERFRRVLDVGCGSGHSSIAWAQIADAVVAIDPSASMLAATQPRHNVDYRVGVAEHLEFAAGEFDLISAASALHWFDQRRFYGECQRVLAADGWIAVYNDHFTTHMQGTLSPLQPENGLAGDPAACKRWMRTRFAKRYPPPRRGMRDMDEGCAAAGGFRVVHRGSFSHVVPFTRHELIAYLLTRSNTLAALERGRESETAMLEWLDRELSPLLADSAVGEFLFKCNFWVMRRG